MKKLTVEIELLEEMLGTNSADAKLHEEFIASKAPDAKTTEQEVADLGVDEVVEKSKTIFAKENGKPFIYDYLIKGFFKEACSMLQRCKGEKISEKSCKLKAFKKIIDGNIFVEPRKIFIDMQGGEVGNCQRPLRAQTAQGERVALANSDTVPAGSRLKFEIECLSDDHVGAVKEWLAYGRFKGLGQWRNSGKGKFKVLSLEESELE